MINISGLKLNFSEDGEVKIKKGEKILPRRLDLVQEAFDKGDYEKVLEIGLNFSTRDCKNGCKIEQLDKEFDLVIAAMDMLEKKSETNEKERIPF